MLKKSEIQIQWKDNARLLHIYENILLFKAEKFADLFLWYWDPLLSDE